METYNYQGIQVVTTESLGEYLTDVSRYASFKNLLSRLATAKVINYYHVPAREAKKFGKKSDYNYPHGLNLFAVADIPMIISKDKSNFLNHTKLSAELPDKLTSTASKSSDSVNFSIASKLSNPTVQMPFDQLFAMIDLQMEKQAAFINILQESNQRLSDEVSKLTQTVDCMLQMLIQKQGDQKSILVEATSGNSAESVFDAPIILKENASYEEWKKVIEHALDLIVRDGEEKNKSTILSNAYKRLRDQFGIVWEQEAREFKEEVGRGPVNTRELCWWMETSKPTYKNLLIGKLNTLYSEARRKKATQEVDSQS